MGQDINIFFHNLKRFFLFTEATRLLQETALCVPISCHGYVSTMKKVFHTIFWMPNAKPFPPVVVHRSRRKNKWVTDIKVKNLLWVFSSWGYRHSNFLLVWDPRVHLLTSSLDSARRDKKMSNQVGSEMCTNSSPHPEDQGPGLQQSMHDPQLRCHQRVEKNR